MQTTYYFILTDRTTQRGENAESKINSLIANPYQLLPVTPLSSLPQEINRFFSFFTSNQPCNQQGGAAA